jgi:tRNA pseudouridine32 synthase/23S rRNA pseudouridine746 synthase
MGVSIIFENDRFLAADKPAGWLTVPGRFGASDSRPCLVTALRAEGRPIWAVHRLDVEASGLVLLAKDAAAHRAANGWFAGREIHKEYEAWTEGEADRVAAECGGRNAKHSGHSEIRIPHFRASGVRTSHAASGGPIFTLTANSPSRARRGFPVAGDTLYGATLPFVPEGIPLRSVKLDSSGCPSAAEYGLPGSLTASGIAEAFGL